MLFERSIEGFLWGGRKAFSPAKEKRKLLVDKVLVCKISYILISLFSQLHCEYTHAKSFLFFRTIRTENLCASLFFHLTDEERFSDFPSSLFY